MKLFEQAQLGNMTLQNRVMMAPMTRCRAIGNTPNELMATYYAQRASAGLLITEGVAPSANGLGYARIPGIYSPEQVAGWKLTTKAVHDKGGKIFIQLMHVGRVGATENFPAGATPMAPSAVQAAGQMWTDGSGMQPHVTPKAMDSNELAQTKAEYVQAAKNAIEAGFDGVELHAANGYLLEQFLNPGTNQRTDEYGGSVENRARFVLEVAKEVAAAIGAERTGIRISPYGVFNDMPAYDSVDETYNYLATELGKLKLVYLHVLDHAGMGAPAIPATIIPAVAKAFGGTIVFTGNLNKESAEALLNEGVAHFASFGRPFIANPNLVERMQQNLPMNAPNFDAFYTPGEVGYTDYV
jgi:N-ethylmaleimide reductase